MDELIDCNKETPLATPPDKAWDDWFAESEADPDSLNEREQPAEQYRANTGQLT